MTAHGAELLMFNSAVLFVFLLAYSGADATQPHHNS